VVVDGLGLPIDISGCTVVGHQYGGVLCKTLGVSPRSAWFHTSIVVVGDQVVLEPSRIDRGPVSLE
jgi:hypothetical protein